MTWGAYVHVPWCRVRCPYCAFEIVTGDAAPPEAAFLDGVLADLARWRPVFDGPPGTLYFGGGTPSRVSVRTLASIAEAVKPTGSITVEANPEDLGGTWLADARAAGIDRLSLGVQTLQPDLLRRVGRAHHDGRGAIEAVASAGFASWSVDLMFGLPGQDRAALDRDLAGILAYDPPHVSIYGLTIEPETGYGRLDARRALPVPEADAWRDMYDGIVATLGAAGLERYEVSNFAKPGHRSTHNALYWTGAPYMGLGPSAHGLAPDGRRWANPPFAAWRSGEPPEIETPDPAQRATDALVSGLRGVEGLDLARLAPFATDPRTLRQLVTAGLLAHEDGHIRLTAAGFPVADAVVRALARGLVAARTG
ncbi:MAG: coproporphyrinogen III oxidase family protein [Alphaproteobacteria bacterium]|nr:coproporphyrinogen III oxidase family protein [Alphaproteobacteria bacterium]